MLIDSIRRGLADRPVVERRMFGGITFMLSGNMLCCASNKGLMVRVGKQAESGALTSPHAQPCLGAGHRMPGFILVTTEGLTDNTRLKAWLNMALVYVETLPAKPLKPSSSKHAKKKPLAKSPRGK